MEEIYIPKSILITGAAGFVASHLANRLVEKYPDYKIAVIDKLDYCANLKNLSRSWSYKNLKFFKGDINDYELVSFILKTESVDTVMHFAAQSHVDNSYGNSFAFTKNNVNGTHSLLEACKNMKNGQIRRFIHVSTYEVYGEMALDVTEGIGESSELLPTNIYSATKAGAEMLVMAYHRSYGFPAIITRGNNVYGPHQYPEKLIPKFILLARKGMPLSIHGDGSNLRCFIYVDDVVDAFEVILSKGEVGNTYNIGTDNELSVSNVASSICRFFSLEPSRVIKFVKNRPLNDKRYWIDFQKLKSLGWYQKTSWEEGLKKTIEWYDSNPDWWGDISNALLPHPGSHNSEVRGSQRDGSIKFLIYGRTGWIGGLLGKICEKEGISFEYGKARVEDRMQVLADITKAEPTHILNAAGLTGNPSADWCESHQAETLRSNMVGVLSLADVCREHGVLMVYYTTGCFFDYDDKHPLGSGIGFKEEDRSNYSGSFFSSSRAMVEEQLRGYDNVLCLRMRMPLSSDLIHPRNLINKLTRFTKVVDIPNSLTVLDELLPISVQMAKRNFKGIWNFTNPGTVTHVEILAMYRDYVDPSFKWQTFTLQEQRKVLLVPRCNNELDATKLKSQFPQILSIKESLIKYVFEPNKRSLSGGAPVKRITSSL